MTSPTERNSSPRSAGAHVDSLGTICCILLALVTIGFVSFRSAFVLPKGASHNVDKCFFSSVNLATLTGFSQSSAAVSEYQAAGQWLVAVLSVLSAGTILAGSAWFLSSVFGVRIRLSRLLTYAAIVLLIAAGIAIGSGAFNAFGAATGFGLLTVRVADALRKTLLVAASVPATLGLSLLLVFFGVATVGTRRETLSLCAILLAKIYFIGMLVFWLTGMTPFDASLTALDTRSLGSGVIPVNESPRAAQWTMMGLMSLGAGPGGVAGGLSVLPLAVLLRAAWCALRGQPVDRIAGVAVAWVALHVTMLFALVIALAGSQPQLPGDRLLFLAISAFSNVGLSHDPVSFSRDGMYLLSSAMIVGRLLPLTMICWMAIVSGGNGNEKT